MPRMDGSGPNGTGVPGRGLGPCGKGTQTQPRRFTSVQDDSKGLGRGKGRGLMRRQRRRISFASSGKNLNNT
jgi:hypothetical protein